MASRYIPAGRFRNCGDRGISPKTFERRQAVLAAERAAKPARKPRAKKPATS